MEIVTDYYLIDAEGSLNGIKLHLFNPQNGILKEILDKDYKPYFYIAYPPNKTENDTIKELDAKITIQKKRYLFSNKVKQMTKVEFNNFSDLKWASNSIEKRWEDSIPYGLSYVYDHGLIFGAQHKLKENKLSPIFEVSKELKARFEDVFSDIRADDPSKYDLLERMFILCSQPIPQNASKILDIDKKSDTDRLYLAFILSRISNLPVQQSYSNRQVSTWIKSILHGYLRRNNILIPTSEELRQSETKRSVQGALTFPAKTGLYFNTIVTDYESLYPSLIDVYNLSHETINCPHPGCQVNRVPGFDHYVCQQRRGVYSVLIGSIKDLRIRWYKPLARNKIISPEEKRLAEATSRLLKLILVAAYGVTVRMHGLARHSLAESITAYSRDILQKTWDIAEEADLHPIYGDTDSLFLDNPTREQIEWLLKTVKKRFRLDLAIDKEYSVCVLPRAKKSYFGIDKDGTPDIKGLTAIKSNSPAFIQKTFKNCVKELSDISGREDFLKAKDHMQNIVEKVIQELYAGNLPLEDLEYSVQIHDEPLEKLKEKMIHQPYQSAIQLLDSGKKVQRRDIIRFVKVQPFYYRGRTFTAKPTEMIKDVRELNLKDYMRNLRTALNQTFKPMNIRFNEDKKRTTLSDFM